MRLLKCGLGKSCEIIYMQDLLEKLQLDFTKKCLDESQRFRFKIILEFISSS